MKKYFNDIGLLTIGLLWGLGFIVAKIAFNSGASPLQLLFIRFLMASIVLSVLFYKTVKKITIKDIKILMTLGIIVYLGYLFQLVGSKYTTASKAAFYTALYIVFVPYVASMLDKKSPTISTLISTILGIIGIFFISFEKGQNVLLLNIGDILVILSAFFFAVQISLTEKKVREVDVTKLVLIQLYISTLLFFIHEIVLVLLGIDEIKLISSTEFWAFAYLGVINSGICIFFQAYFQKYVSAVKASLLLTTESLFAPIFAFLILHEKIGINVLIGGTLIFLALVVLEIKLFERKIK